MEYHYLCLMHPSHINIEKQKPRSCANHDSDTPIFQTSSAPYREIIANTWP